MSKVAISTAVNQEAPQGGTGSEPTALSSADRLIFEQVKVAARAAEEKKAQGVLVLRLSAITEFTDYFIICAGNSTRQTQAIYDAVIEVLKRITTRSIHTEVYEKDDGN